MSNSKPKFTPGPWHALKYPDVKSWTVASKESVASKIKTEEDAHLLAAAPEMYEALEHLHLLWGDALKALLDHGHQITDFEESISLKTEAILAKARGEK